MNNERKNESSLSRLLTYAGRHKNLTILGCILSGISAVLAMAPYICIWFVARGIFVSMPDLSGAYHLVKYGWAALAIVLLSILFYFAALMCTHLAAFRTATNMRMAAAKHLVDVPMGFFNTAQSGKLRKLIDDNAAMTETLLAHQLPDLAGVIVTPVAAIVLLFVFDWRMGLLCLLPMVISVFLLTLMMGGKNARFFSRYQKAIEDLSSEATEYVRGIPVVKVFQQTVFSFKAFYTTIMGYRDMASDYALSCRKPMTGFTTSLNGTFILLIPAGLLLAGAASDKWRVFSDFLFYILFTPMCAVMVARIMYATESLMQADEAVRKLDEILQVTPLAENSNPESVDRYDVEFKNVTFTYPDAVTAALSQVNFHVYEKSTVALVGASGSGKSTIAGLIPRFFDVQEGSVLIGGVNVRNISTGELMKHIAFVFQDTHLFKASILDNIRAARPEADITKVLEAAHAAQCDDILAKLPNGIDTVIGAKGVYLSGGECQRIALARAILKDAPIVVLDEATAFADPENEALIQKAFEELTRGKTVIMIAHRLSTVRNADCILVTAKGRIMESGTHNELLQQNGIYASMWRDYQTSANWKVGKENCYVL
jgi:ATP-binding cassette subfamily B protein